MDTYELLFDQITSYLEYQRKLLTNNGNKFTLFFVGSIFVHIRKIINQLRAGFFMH